MKNFGSLALCALSAVMLVSGCVDREAQNQSKRTQEILRDETIPVRVADPSTDNLVSTLEITGQIATSDDVQVGAQVSGRLVAVYVKDGDSVRPGQVIARQETQDNTARMRQAMAALNSARTQLRTAQVDARQGPVKTDSALRAAEERVRQARASYEKLKRGARDEERRQVKAQVEAARSNMETAKKEWERDEELVRQGAISQAQADRTHNAYISALKAYEQSLESQRLVDVGARSEDLAVAEAQLRAAEQDLRSTRASKNSDVQFQLRVDQAREAVAQAEEQLAIARKSVSDADIRSPFSGVVSGRPLTPGTYLQPGMTVARIVGEGGVYFEGQVPESQLESISTGRSVQLKVQALGGDLLSGTVIAVSPVGSNVGRVFKVRVSINEGAGRLKPGMFARGIVETGSFPTGFVIPTAAILKSGGSTFVFKVADGVAKKVEVKVLGNRADRSQVEGVEPGDKVVVSGQEQLVDKAKVRIETQAKEK